MNEFLESYGARRGVETRYPLLDIRLIRFVLALPLDLRLPRGMSKMLPRRAGVLPPVIADRVGKVEFTEVVRRHVLRHLPRIERLLPARGPWRIEPFVERQEARQMLDRARSLGGVADLKTLWNFAMLEVWLRGLASV